MQFVDPSEHEPPPRWPLEPELRRALLAILTRHDPMGICGEDNPSSDDEYGPEVNTILPRLAEASDAGDITRIVLEEFDHWFSPVSLEPRQPYLAIGKEIWTVLKEIGRK